MNNDQLPSKPRGAKWTDEQWAGIATTGRSVLVSAAAGSGKTAVLAERCAFLVCDATPPCDVDELLVVTFTEAAAAEMKARIETALHARLGDSSDRRLARQLALIDRAQVSTLHGFCSKLIRQHFHLLGLDPAFTIIDGDEASLLRREVARQLLVDMYESPQAEPFQQLVDAYGDGNDERLVARIIDAHELLCSLVDPAKWLDDSRRRIVEVDQVDFEKTQLGQELIGELRRRIEALGKSCNAAIEIVSKMPGFAAYVKDLEDCRQIARHWWEVLKKHGIDALAEEASVELPRLPPVKNDVPGKETAKALVDAVREQIKSGTLRKTLAFNKAQWVDGLKRIRPHAELFLELVEEFGKRYAGEKSALRGVDFSDLERMALRALRDDAGEPTAVARMLHRQFAHVLVDEYQDINELQDAILRLVSRECVGPRANLFAVGDVKQSIYGFRLAEPARFLERQARFRKAASDSGRVIDLQANFRSRAPLLDVVNRVFVRLMTKGAADMDYDASHELRPGLKYPAGDKSCFTGAPVELHLLPADIDPQEVDVEEIEPERAAREALLVARLIRQMTGDDGSTPMCVMEKSPGGELRPRPIRYGDIVVLLRAMRFKGDDYADVLRDSGIPVHSETGTGYFDSMEVRDVLALLAVLDNRRQDIPLAAVLRSPLASLPHAEDALARIRLAYPKHEVPFHEAVMGYAFDGRHDDELAARLRQIVADIDRWREMAQRRPLAELIWDIYDSTGYLAFCAGLRDGEQRKANLIDLHERARQFGSFQRQGLSRFLSFLDRLREDSDLGQPAIASEGENVVRIMTVHRSKGLEFPVVIMPDLGKGINLRSCAGSVLFDRHAHLGMDVVDDAKQVRYPSLASMLVGNRLRQQAMAEELRVLYVAMTRAREHLVLVGTCKPTAPDSWDARWSNHDGPLPAEEVLGARCMLEWLGPVAAAIRADGQAPIQIIRHAGEEVASWESPEKMRPQAGKMLEKLARFEPLAGVAKDDVADQIIARLTATYPHQPFTKLPAVQAATALVKDASPDRRGRETRSPFERGPALELPRAVRSELKPSAADVGSATHLVLQHLDFTRPCDAGDIRAQLDALVAKRLIAMTQASAVDVDSICWLVGGSIVGKLIRDNHASVRRELPLYIAREDDDAKSADPQDRIMIRSRLDVLIDTPDGLHIVDYKTDRIGAEQIDQRVAHYRPQMSVYRDAIETITGRKITAIHMVFLSARKVVQA